MSGLDGAMRADAPSGHGFWDGDTRVLSEYRIRVDGEEPVGGEFRLEAGSLQFRGTAGGLEIARERFVDAGMHDRITLTNPGRSSVRKDVELTFDADYANMMALRGMAPGLAAPSTIPEPPVTVRPPGTVHRVDLAPGGQFTLVVDVLAGGDFDVGLARVRDAYREWAAGCAGIETDNAAVNELLERSRDDLRMLLDVYPTGIYPAAGMPWYAVPFGRDALFVSLLTLPLNPELARATLRFLAARQGRRVDRATEEQPGKILHEVRTGAAVDQGLWPGTFYGDVDGAALFICLLAEASDWTGDEALVEAMWPAAEAALAWCDTYGDSNGDGYIECYTGRGRNQAWKDSDDSLTHVDGTDAAGHSALCEVQGYLYRALLTMARRRPELTPRAEVLARNFNRDFDIPGDGFIAQALDAGKGRVEAISSNPAHCLWSGILSPEHARAVAARLVSPEMFTGWGMRDLSRRAVNYDPRNGSNGCVIPFDNAIAAWGLRRAGFAAEAELVARCLLEAGIEFPDRRMPEFFCGFDRVANEPPEEHPASCSPQAWSAAAPFSLVFTMLGLEADASRGRLRVSPYPTALWNRVEVHGLHFAGRRIDLEVEDGRVKSGALPPDVRIETA